MTNQSREIRKKKHVKFIEHKKHLIKQVKKESKPPSKESSQHIVNLVKSSVNNNAGDSTISRVREDILKNNKREVKSRFFRGATIEDLDDNIRLALKKETRLCRYLCVNK